MINASRRLKSVKRDFEPYQDRSNYIRMDRNEDPVGWEEQHFKSWLDSITVHDLAAYKDPNFLINKLSNWLGVSTRRLYVTAGSDAAIKNVFETYVDPGDRVILQEPGWRMYGVYADIYGASQILTPYENDLSFDTNSIVDTIKNDTIRMVVLANPNQPTGSLISDTELERIIKVAKQHDTLVVIDEAYYLFTSATVLSHLKENDNLIIIRTFSKAFGMAGLRVGYCLASPDRINEIMLLRPITDSNSFALSCAEYALNHIEWMKSRINSYILGREYLFEKMINAGINTYVSHTNFLLIKCNSINDCQLALSKIKKLGYLLKGPFDFKPLKNCIRVSVGPLELMQQFWTDCNSILCKHASY